MAHIRKTWTSLHARTGAGLLSLVVGEALTVRVAVLGQDKLPLDLTGLVDAAATLNASDGTSIATLSVSVDDLTAGALLVAVTTTATAAAKTAARLTIALNFGATRDETTQPIGVEVLAR